MDFMQVRIAKGRREKDLAKRLRYKIFCEELKWIPSEDFPDGLETDEWDDAAVHLIAIREEKVFGTIRLIWPNPLGLPIETEWSVSDEVKSSKPVEVSRFAVDNENNYLPHVISLSLIRAAFIHSIEKGVICWVAALDQVVWRMLRSLGIKFSPIGETKIYLGSRTVPGVLTLSDLRESLLKNYRNIYELLFDRTDIMTVEQVQEFLTRRG